MLRIAGCCGTNVFRNGDSLRSPHSAHCGARSARVAFIKVQTDESLQRGMMHRSRVRKTHYMPGDLVYIYREKSLGRVAVVRRW